MKVSLNRKIDFTDVDSQYVLTLHALVKIIQEAAIKHSSMTGPGSNGIINDGMVWILYQSGIKIFEWPKYGDHLKVVTWHRGMLGFKAFREFEIYSGDKKLGVASSVYLFYDLENRKIKRIPKNADDIYSLENESAHREDLAQWKPIARFESEFDLSITTRLSDYDPMGHVNNSIYLDYVETLLFSYLKKETKIKEIKILYSKEIDKSVPEVITGLIKVQNGYQFKIFDDSKVFAYGEISI